MGSVAFMSCDAKERGGRGRREWQYKEDSTGAALIGRFDALSATRSGRLQDVTQMLGWSGDL
jgi:hypothetical protein